MYNEEFIKGREGLVLKNLILDEIAVLKRFFEERKYFKGLIDKEGPLSLLEKIYSSINDEDVTNLEHEYKIIVLELLKRRIEDLDNDLESNSNEEDEDSVDISIQYISDLILFEYKSLYNKFLISILDLNININHKNND